MQRRKFITLSAGAVAMANIGKFLPSALAKEVISGTAIPGKMSAVTYSSLLNEMCDPASLAYWPVQGWKNLQASALNTDARHNAGEFGPKAIGHFVRIEEKAGGKREWVLMEHEGPGAIVRMWAPNMAKDAIFRVYFDGSNEPGIEVNMMEFFYGNDFVKPPFAAIKARGGNVFLPIPFSQGCKVTVDKNVCGWAEPPDLFYIIQYRAYDKGTSVKTFNLNDYKADNALLIKTGVALDDPSVKNLHPEILLNKKIEVSQA
jgi:hypothetical protein